MMHRRPNQLLNHVCETLLTVALVSLLALMVPAVTAAMTLRDVEVDADLIVPMKVRPPDVLFLWGQLMTLLTLWLYFRCFVPLAKDTSWAHLRSVVLAAVLALNNYFAMLEPMLPYRGFFVSLVLLLTWIDDVAFIRKFPKSKIVREWHDKVLATFATAFLASVGFWLLLNLTSRATGEPLTPREWELLICTGYYVGFVFITTRSFRKNYLFFQNPDSWDELRPQLGRS